jgi:hypothetical protein
MWQFFVGSAILPFLDLGGFGSRGGLGICSGGGDISTSSTIVSLAAPPGAAAEAVAAVAGESFDAVVVGVELSLGVCYHEF